MPSQGCNWYYHECVVGGGGQWGWLRDNGLGWWGYNGDEWSPLLIPIVSLLPQDHSSSPSWEGGVEGRQQGWVILIVPPFPPSLGGTFPPTPTLIRQGNGENSLIFPHCLIGVGSGKNRENSHWVRVFLILSWGWGGVMEKTLSWVSTTFHTLPTLMRWECGGGKGGGGEIKYKILSVPLLRVFKTYLFHLVTL